MDRSIFLRILYKNKIKLTIIFLLLVILTIIIIQKTSPRIILKKGDNITINYKSKYKEAGYTLMINKKDYSRKVKVIGKVNTKKLGTYKLTYTYHKGIYYIKKVRTIKVKDLDKPLITLSGSLETHICPDTEYKEEGYKAIDNYDGDITKKVRVDNIDGYVIYTVIDSNNNKTKIKRKIINDDIVKPDIKLEGNATMQVVIGNNFKDPGYFASDNCDGDITSKVEVKGNVDTNTIGTYKIEYNIIDTAGNINSVIRTVNVVPKPDGAIYLTFDDGPLDGTTNVILDILKEEGVVATFFVTNHGPDYLIKREYDEGHSIALHTASHDYSIVYASDESYFNDLYSVRDRVKRITGYDSKIIRFPGGASNTVSRKYSSGIMSRLTQEVLNRGFKYYDWNISSGDAGGTTTADGVYNNVVNNLSRTRINMVLMHDIKPWTRDALRRIIRYGKENGYTFAKIDENTPMVTQRVNN